MNISKSIRDSIPETYGIPVNDAYTLNRQATLWKHGNTYTLDFDSVTEELKTAFDMGLENYGSGMSSFVIPRILKMNNNANRPAQIWHLYISQVCGDYEPHKVNKAWHSYTPEQQAFITAQCNDYLESCLEYLTMEF